MGKLDDFKGKKGLEATAALTETADELTAAQQAELIANAPGAAEMEPPRPKIEKTLANCKPREFMKQTYRVKKFAEVWLTETDIMNIRKNVPTPTPMPAPTPIPKDASDDEAAAIRKADREKRAEIEKANKEAEEKAGLANFSRMFDAIFGEHPDETLELLALCCFVERERIDDYMMSDYLDALTDILKSDAVRSFFTSFMSLARTITGDTLKA